MKPLNSQKITRLFLLFFLPRAWAANFGQVITLTKAFHLSTRIPCSLTNFYVKFDTKRGWMFERLKGECCPTLKTSFSRAAWSSLVFIAWNKDSQSWFNHAMKSFIVQWSCLMNSHKYFLQQFSLVFSFAAITIGRLEEIYSITGELEIKR